jgi:hypothetical protein
LLSLRRLDLKNRQVVQLAAIQVKIVGEIVANEKLIAERQHSNIKKNLYS